MTHDENIQWCSLFLKLGASDIARHLNISRGTVNSAMSRMRAEGKLPPLQESKRFKILQLAKQGYTARQIQHILGYKQGTVAGAMNGLRKLGKLPPLPDKNLAPELQLARHTRYELRKVDKIFGSWFKMANSLTQDQFDWLVDEMVKTECESVQEYVAELVRDAYEERPNANT